MNKPDIKPFANCPALDGYHCQTNSLAKIYNFHGHPLSEDMLLGLGAGMGFIYWQMKLPGGEKMVFIGGRANTKEFFDDVGRRTGVSIKTVTTSSAKKAESALIEKLAAKEPVMLFGDMGMLPWFDMPDDYHFGGHTFTVCGYDGRDRVLASDMDQRAAGLKEGFYFPATLEQLARARGSIFKPFPPKNARLEFDFSGYHEPGADEIESAIAQTVEAQLDPPIKNLGVKGIRHTARELPKWPKMFGSQELAMNLFSLYIFIEIGGTGGGCFRYMYARFLREAAKIASGKQLVDAAELMEGSGRIFTRIGSMFSEPGKTVAVEEKIAEAAAAFTEIADIEEQAFSLLGGN